MKRPNVSASERSALVSTYGPRYEAGEHLDALASDAGLAPSTLDKHLRLGGVLRRCVVCNTPSSTKYCADHRPGREHLPCPHCGCSGKVTLDGGPRIRTRPRARRTDARYASRYWQRVRLTVLRRDGYQCRVVPGCPTKANVADHVNPVYPGMPDSEFYAMWNLRASCRAHNIGRALMGSAVPVDAGVVTRNYT